MSYGDGGGRKRDDRKEKNGKLGIDVDERITTVRTHDSVDHKGMSLGDPDLRTLLGATVSQSLIEDVWSGLEQNGLRPRCTGMMVWLGHGG